MSQDILIVQRCYVGIERSWVLHMPLSLCPPCQVNYTWVCNDCHLVMAFTLKTKELTMQIIGANSPMVETIGDGRTMHLAVYKPVL